MTSRREFIQSAAALGGALALGGPGAAMGGEAKGAGPAAGPGNHLLAPLPYPFDALEPFIDAATMELHHDKHHAAYVKGLNAAELALADAREKNDFEKIAALEGALAFHGSGHANHTIFWANMAPKVKAKIAPTGALLDTVVREFGGLDALKAQMSAAATRVEGNGWGALVWHPGFQRLYTLGIMNHQNMGLTGTLPLLLCDVWEHAYYLKYQNKRSDYISAWWNVVDWADVEARFTAARMAG
jgi:Fe-Mn family superoxide dismutase